MSCYARWQNSSNSTTSTASPASSPDRQGPGRLRRPAGGGHHPPPPPKKTVCGVCGQVVSDLLRQAATARPRPLLWRQARLPRLLGAPGPVPAVRRREERTLGLAGRQPALHQAVRLLRGPTLPRDAPSRRWPRNCYLDWHTVKELDKQYMREQLRRAGTPAPRVIGIDEIAIAKGHQLPHRRQRPGAGPADLVRRQGPLRGEPGRVLRLARPGEMRQNPPGGHGHVEGVPQLHPQGGQRPAGHDPVRQVPHPQAPGRSDGQGAQAGVRPPVGRRTGGSSRGRGTRCCRTGRTSPPRGRRP